MTNDIWKPIAGYEGLYAVSSNGKIARTDNGFQLLKERIDNKGYSRVNLSKNGVLHTVRVHRLVAEHFIINPHGLSEINHIDEDKSNNSVTNLEWCSRKYNINYGTRTKKQSEKISKPVVGYSANQSLSFESGSEAAIQLGLHSPSGIFACCKGRRKTAGGLMWRYADE